MNQDISLNLQQKLLADFQMHDNGCQELKKNRLFASRLVKWSAAQYLYNFCSGTAWKNPVNLIAYNIGSAIQNYLTSSPDFKREFLVEETILPVKQSEGKEPITITGSIDAVCPQGDMFHIIEIKYRHENWWDYKLDKIVQQVILYGLLFPSKPDRIIHDILIVTDNTIRLHSFQLDRDARLSYWKYFVAKAFAIAGAVDMKDFDRVRTFDRNTEAKREIKEHYVRNEDFITLYHWDEK
jgi:hypothetical protein